MKSMRSFQYIFLVTNFLLRVGITMATKEYSSYRRYPVCKPIASIRYPKNTDDVVGIVKEAISKGLKVKAFGSRHSQTDIICTEGIPVDMTGLRAARMNDDDTATFGAGLNVHEITSFLRLYDRGLENLPCFGNITIGGAIGTGAHGSTIKYRDSLSAQVAGVKIVDGMGEIKTITDPTELKAFRIHLGLLGIVVEVTLNTVELYKTLAHNYVVPDDILTNGVAADMARNADQVSLYWFPEFNEVVVANWTVIDKETPGTDKTNYFAPSAYSNLALVASLAKEIAFSLMESNCAVANTLGYTLLHVFEYVMELALLIPVPDFIPIYSTQKGLFKNPSVGYYNEMFTTICYDEPKGTLGSACSWSHGVNSVLILDNEFNLDLRRLGEFTKVVKDIIKKTPTVFPINGIHIRFSGKSDIYMSTSYGRQSAHVEFFAWKRDDEYKRAMGSSAGYQTILQTLAKDFGARSHWGKSGLVYHNREMLDMKLDETARRKFIGVMSKYDPNEVFMNNFGRRLKRTGTKIDTDPLTKHCAILDNCFCSNNSDCAANQICSQLSGYFHKVCKTRNEVSPVRFDKSILPPPFRIFPFLVSEVPTLVKSVLSNCSLTDAIGTVGLLLPGILPVEKVLETAGTLGKKLGEIRSLGDVVGAVGEVVDGVLHIGTGKLGN
ncbi:L-gulono-1,4-lactone dehydrogenase-like [Bradysia coprophila]|uniref:L-gulono-1,4-lactone dehydrogenase-like n=1 Tax=Bradysia coprophila TaxID=38358 RepID=UPI00187DBD8B|nr:L-gulono-1,4-lactone dehydrogenase-like [Bradysia coprophila]